MEVIVTAACTSCPATREIRAGEIPPGEVPMCDRCGNPMVPKVAARRPPQSQRIPANPTRSAERSAWLCNGLRHWEGVMRDNARRARKAYRTEPWKSLAARMATAYDAAADAFAAELAKETKREPRRGR